MSDEEERPRVAGTWEEPDEVARAVFTAIGQVVFAVAGLETSLQMEVSRLLIARAAVETASEKGKPLDEQLAGLDHMTAGRLLARLRDLGVPDELDRRIGAVIDRRNALVHHTLENAVLLEVIGKAAPIEAVVEPLKQLATDAAELTVELQLFAMPKLEAMLGMSLRAMTEIAMAVDPATLGDTPSRRQLEAVQAFAKIADLGAAFDGMHAEPA